MRKRDKDIVSLPKTEEDEIKINALKKVRYSLCDKAYINRFMASIVDSAEISEAQRGLIDRLLYKYRKQTRWK